MTTRAPLLSVQSLSVRFGGLMALVYGLVFLPVIMRSSLAEYLRGHLPAGIMRHLDMFGRRSITQT